MVVMQRITDSFSAFSSLPHPSPKEVSAGNSNQSHAIRSLKQIDSRPINAFHLPLVSPSPFRVRTKSLDGR